MRAFALLLLAAAACTPYQPVARNVRVADLGAPERTKLTSRFTWDTTGDRSLENTVPGTSVEAVTDEATIVNIDGRTCVRFVMRTGQKHDAPFGEWGITINGEKMFPEQETSSQRTVEVAGERTVVDAAYVGRHRAGTFQVTEPTTDEYAIVERQGYFCPSVQIVGKLAFNLKREYNGMPMREEFVWTIVN